MGRQCMCPKEGRKGGRRERGGGGGREERISWIAKLHINYILPLQRATDLLLLRIVVGITDIIGVAVLIKHLGELSPGPLATSTT